MRLTKDTARVGVIFRSDTTNIYTWKIISLDKNKNNFTYEIISKDDKNGTRHTAQIRDLCPCYIISSGIINMPKEIL
jgi:hypothetical protein